jgi:hypothetical protein
MNSLPDEIVSLIKEFVYVPKTYNELLFCCAMRNKINLAKKMKKGDLRKYALWYFGVKETDKCLIFKGQRGFPHCHRNDYFYVKNLRKKGEKYEWVINYLKNDFCDVMRDSLDEDIDKHYSKIRNYNRFNKISNDLLDDLHSDFDVDLHNTVTDNEKKWW